MESLAVMARKDLIALLAATVVLIGFAAPSGVAAVLPSGPTFDNRSSQFRPQPPAASLATQDDLAVWAAQNGTTREAAEQRFVGVNEFNAAMTSFSTSHSDSFVTAVWGEGAGTIYTRPGASGAATEILARMGARGVAVEIDRPNAGQQEAIQLDAMDRFWRHTSHPMSTHFDVLADRPTLLVDIAGLPHEVPGLQFAAVAISGELGLPVVVQVEENAAGELAASGGMTYSGLPCTGGFIGVSTVVKGSWGIITAHHCDQAISNYDGSTAGTSSVVSNRDLRITRLSGGAGPQNRIRNNWGTWRTITGANNPATGSSICKFGVTSGQSCDTVESNGNCTGFYPGYTFCGLYRTVNANVQGGDSGGPWYWDAVGYGITSGTNRLYGYDFFTGVGALGPNLYNFVVDVT